MTRVRLSLTLVATLAAACTATGSQQPTPDVDREALLADLRVLSADDMEGRLTGTAGAAKARAYIIDRLEASGARPFGESFEQPFTFSAPSRAGEVERTGVNIVGRVVGRANPDRYIAITAHYDHLGAHDGRVFNGADDNASGTAALFAIAQYFSANPPESSLLLAAVDAEEGGLLGAAALVSDPPVPLEAVALNLNLDMIGRDPANQLFAVGTYHYPFLKPYIEQVAARAPVTLRMGHDEPGKPDVEDWTRDSDHYAFHERGIPFIYFGVEDFGEHHQPTDDYETITHDFYVRAVETIISAVSVFDANVEAIRRARDPR